MSTNGQANLIKCLRFWMCVRMHASTYPCMYVCTYDIYVLACFHLSNCLSEQVGIYMNKFIHSFTLFLQHLFKSTTTQRHSRDSKDTVLEKDLPKVPTWQPEWNLNPQPFGRKATNLPMSHHSPQRICWLCMHVCVRSSTHAHARTLLNRII